MSMEENKINKYVTEEYLDKRLDDRLNEQTQVIIEAVSSIIEKRTKEVRDELYIVRGELKKDIEDAKDELRKDINNVQTLIDGYVKAQEDFKKDFVIVKEEVRQIKEIIKEKLGLEIKAI